MIVTSETKVATPMLIPIVVSAFIIEVAQAIIRKEQ